MHAFPVPRKQGDGLNDQYSNATGLICDENDLTRQEFKDDTDINVLMSKFGVMPGTNDKPIQGAEIDYDLDLQVALQTLHDARKGFNALPDDVRDKYGTLAAFLAAVEDGTFETPEAEAKRKADTEAAAKAARLAELRELINSQPTPTPEATP